MSNERFWDQIQPLLDEQRVIPVVGRDLLMLELDGRRANLYEHLAARLARRLGVGDPVPRSLDELASRYMTECRQPLEDIYPALKKELSAIEAMPPPPALQRLAAIGWFRLFVATTFDDFLYRAVDAARCGGAGLATSLSFGLMSNFKDLPDDFEQLQRPLVYQLLGRASAVQDSYAVTDEDLLEFVHTLQVEGQRPRRLFEALERSHLLLIGSGFSPWLVRFFLRAVKHRERLWQVRGRAGFVVDGGASDDTALLDFLRHYSDRTLVYRPEHPDAPAAELVEGFVDALWQRWSAGQAAPAVSQPRPTAAAGAMARHAVFISYASEDRPIVEKLWAQLDAAGIDAWFDRLELAPGQTWGREIAANIDAAAAFVPVISSSVLAGRSGGAVREFRVEWERALELRQRRPREASGAAARFVLPVVVDDTPMQSPGVGPYFGDVQAVAARGGRLPDDFVDLLRQCVRAAQL